KQANPEGPTSFPFSASPSPLANFSLVDNGTTANTQVFGNITTFTNTFSVAETPIPAEWTFTSLSCSVDAGGLGSTHIATSGASVSIDLAEGDGVTCTYTNTEQGHIILKKVTLPSGDSQSLGV